MSNELAPLRDAIAGLLDASGELIWSLDLDGRWTYLSAAAARLYGRQPAELVGRPFAEQVARELQERDTAVLDRVFAGEPVFGHETRHQRSDGSYVDLSVSAAARRDDTGRVVGAFGTARDITERKLAAVALHENIEKLRLAVEAAGLHYWESDATRWGEYATAVHPEDRDRYLATGRAAIARGESFDIEYRVAGADGYPIWFSSRGVPLRDPVGNAGRMVGVSQDITERKQREDEVRFLAYHDSLTGLPNRRLLDDRLRQALYLAERRDRTLAALVVDLDDFKRVNDTAGHRAGDAVLREVALRLNTCVRRADTVARQGGDEFVVVLSDLPSEADCVVVAEKLLRVLGQPFEVEGRSFQLGASIGIAVFPADGADGELLMRSADAAMYRAKQQGGHQYRFHA